MDKSDTQDTVAAVAVITTVAVWEHILIAAVRGVSLIVSKPGIIRVVTAGPIMGCRSVTGAGVVWADGSVFFLWMMAIETVSLAGGGVVTAVVVVLSIVLLATVFVTVTVLLVLFGVLLLYDGKDLGPNDLLTFIAKIIVFVD